MPPKDKPQLSAEDRTFLLDWVERYLHAEAGAQAGDPGPVMIRRLSNAEYTYTSHELTGIDSVAPAREFPERGGDILIRVQHSTEIAVGDRPDEPAIRVDAGRLERVAGQRAHVERRRGPSFVRADRSVGLVRARARSGRAARRRRAWSHAPAVGLRTASLHTA